ncbi:MAG: LEA type 2 family protein [Kiloniellaceae bacterium]
MGIRLLFGVMVLSLAAGCAALVEAEPPHVGVSDIRLLGGGLLEQRMELTLRVGNPNNFDLPLDGLAFDLDVNERPFARGFTNQAIVVPRLGEVTIPVQATTGLLDMMGQVLNLGTRDDLSYRLVGHAYLRGPGGRALPFEQSGRLRLSPAPAGERALAPL